MLYFKSLTLLFLIFIYWFQREKERERDREEGRVGERERKREREESLRYSTHSCSSFLIHWLLSLYVPRLGVEATALAHRGVALTNWPSLPGPCDYFCNRQFVLLNPFHLNWGFHESISKDYAITDQTVRHICVLLRATPRLLRKHFFLLR